LTSLYFDCFSGASGDMILGALIDAGVPFDAVQRALGSLAIPAGTVWTTRIDRGGIAATKFHVRGEAEPESRHAAGAAASRGLRRHSDVDARADHGSEHRHPHDRGRESAPTTTFAPGRAEGHRTLLEVEALIDSSALSAPGRERAKSLFHRLAAVEARIHDTPVEDVHLHEVGAVDSIIDIVGTVFALETLGISQVMASPLNVGSGIVRSAHGLYPVPAPATAALLTGVPIYAGDQQAELVTPTGALLVTAYATDYGPLPPMRIQRVGYGAGARDLPDTPNVLRVIIGESDGRDATHAVVVIEAEIDDMNPQIFGVLMDRLLAAGALDVYYTPIQMKKNRPGTLLTIVAEPESREQLTGIVFRETTTIGVRYRDMARERLTRDFLQVDTPYGTVRIKVARRAGVVMNAAPEFDDCAARAAECGVPIKDVQAAAVRAYLDSLSPTD
jgi:pyridinium-3,5-bisthiocarboxylic acid mononucleotide nickel chelatase